MASKDLLATNTQLPAHLRKAAAAAPDKWATGQSHGFPVLSTKGKVFHISQGDDYELVTDPETGEQANGINIIVLDTHDGVSKVYYDKGYEEGDRSAPTCYSLNGIEPEKDADDRQAKKCALCPHNQWGSRITDSGSKGKACSDQKRLAVSPAGDIKEPMLLRLPPMTLRNWDTYVKGLVRKGLTPSTVITRISFEPKVAYPELLFKATDFVTEEMMAEIEEATDLPQVASIIGSAGMTQADATVAPVDDDEDEEDAPPIPPKPKAKPKPKPKAKPAPPPEPEESDDEDEDDDDLGDLDFDDLDFGDDDDDDD